MARLMVLAVVLATAGCDDGSDGGIENIALSPQEFTMAPGNCYMGEVQAPATFKEALCSEPRPGPDIERRSWDLRVPPGTIRLRIIGEGLSPDPECVGFERPGYAIIRIVQENSAGQLVETEHVLCRVNHTLDVDLRAELGLEPKRVYGVQIDWFRMWNGGSTGAIVTVEAVVQ